MNHSIECVHKGHIRICNDNRQREENMLGPKKGIFNFDYQNSNTCHPDKSCNKMDAYDISQLVT